MKAVKQYFKTFNNIGNGFLYFFVVCIEFICIYFNLKLDILIKLIFYTGPNDRKILTRLRHISSNVNRNFQLAHLINMRIIQTINPDKDLDIIELVIADALHSGNFIDIKKYLTKDILSSTLPLSFKKYFYAINCNDNFFAECYDLYFDSCMELLSEEITRNSNVYRNHVSNFYINKIDLLNSLNLKLNTIDPDFKDSSDTNEIRYIVSCDYNYFILFAHQFISNFKQYHSDIVHMYVVYNKSYELKSLLDHFNSFSTEMNQIKIIPIKFIQQNHKCTIATFSSYIRFVEGFKLMSTQNCSVVILDVDLHFNKNIANLLDTENFDAGFIKDEYNYTPWSKYSVGISFFKCNKAGYTLLGLIEEVLNSTIRTKLYWTIDQFSVFIALESLKEFNIKIRTQNIPSIKALNFYMPHKFIRKKNKIKKVDLFSE